MGQKKLVLSISCLFLTFFLFFINCTAYGGGFGKAISVGETLPQFTLTAPGSDMEQKYLGLEHNKPFKLSQLPADFVLIEIFSRICLQCLKQAPDMNKLYKFIAQDSDLRNSIKMIGIGQGDTDKKIKVWKTKLRVPFPLFSDPKREVHKKFGSPSTPYTVVINKSGKVLYAHRGVIKDMESMVGRLKKMQ